MRRLRSPWQQSWCRHRRRGTRRGRARADAEARRHGRLSGGQRASCLNPSGCGGSSTVDPRQKVLAGLCPRPRSRASTGARLRGDVHEDGADALTYTIRPEARWSDGVPVTARDFVFADRACARSYPARRVPRPHPQIAHRVDVKKVSSRPEIALRGVAAGLFFWLVLPRHALAGQDLTRIWTDRIDNPKSGKPIGNGQFLVRGSTRSASAGSYPIRATGAGTRCCSTG